MLGGVLANFKDANVVTAVQEFLLNELHKHDKLFATLEDPQLPPQLFKCSDFGGGKNSSSDNFTVAFSYQWYTLLTRKLIVPSELSLTARRLIPASSCRCNCLSLPEGSAS